MTDDDGGESHEARAVRLYRERVPSRAIMTQTGLSLWAVYKALDAAGVPRRGRPDALMQGPRIRTQRAREKVRATTAQPFDSRASESRRHEPDSPQRLTADQRYRRDRELADAYADDSLTLGEITRVWNVGRETVRRAARKFNVPVREKQPVTLAQVAVQSHTTIADTVAQTEAEAANARMLALATKLSPRAAEDQPSAARLVAAAPAMVAPVSGDRRTYRVTALVEQVIEAETPEDALRQARGYAGVKDVLAVRQMNSVRY